MMVVWGLSREKIVGTQLQPQYFVCIFIFIIKRMEVRGTEESKRKEMRRRGKDKNKCTAPLLAPPSHRPTNSRSPSCM
jgi:hypothetical protein